ncbi:MAG: 23S rRNA (uracil(1939)-C(5))-methyltransferase RlmD [Clostridia bacterium]|nr:23S rRNA (uracil(1939)-C(5))-methyltransferase RlmD [Clostridia bacterium]
MLRLLVGDIIEGEVIDLGVTGEGVVKYDTLPIFVPFALPYEMVRVRINYVKKDYAFGDLIEVLKPSNERVKPRCCYFGKCGGCDLQHMSKAVQLEIKRTSVERSLRRNGGFDYDVPPVVSLNDWGYRNKLSLPFGINGLGDVVVGFYEKRTHKVVSMKHCALHGDWASELIEIVTKWANEHRLSVYNENTGKGALRHLVARKLDGLQVTLVVNDDSIDATTELGRALEEKFGDVTVFISSNKKNTNVILGDGARLVYGKESEQNLGMFKAVVSPMSFLQVNAKVRDAIYNAVADSLKGFEGDIVELYSGVGLLTAEIASRLPRAKITSVEIVKEAVKDAKQLMTKLGFNHRVTCIADDATKFMAKLNGKAQNSAIILDPPRKGCSPEVLEAILHGEFAKIIYISCNPATLGRDLKTLTQKYTIDSLQPYDMFPQTSHVESVVCLSRKENARLCARKN